MLRKIFSLVLTLLLAVAMATVAAAAGNAEQPAPTAKVYFTKDISPEGLMKAYKTLGRELHGKVAVKISTGEAGGHNYLQPSLIAGLVKSLDGTIVECCTAYAGQRTNPTDHWPVIKEHGFTAIAPCDMMDENGEMSIPVQGGFHLDKDIIGAHFQNYDSMLILSHFKGHKMGGFGGALKNMSIGIASPHGKAYIHSAGVTTDPQTMWQNLPPQDAFLESMADACKGVISYMGAENILYISVANNLSVDCDCSSNPETPEMADIGIFASTDPVALDQACYDAVVNSPDPGKAALIERMDSRHAIHTVEAAAQHGLGTRNYEIVNLD